MRTVAPRRLIEVNSSAFDRIRGFAQPIEDL
jgi:hypothetical protein